VSPARDIPLPAVVAERNALAHAGQELVDVMVEYAQLCMDCRDFIAGFADDAARQPLVGTLLARLDEALPPRGEPFPWAEAWLTHRQRTRTLPDLASFRDFEIATRPGALAP
jgi:hypothetical protein